MPKINLLNHLETRGTDYKSNPLLLGNKKLHAATNLLFEEGVIRTRPDFDYIPLGTTGEFQGAASYSPRRGLSYAPLSDAPDGLLTVVAGAVFFHAIGTCEGERISRAVFCDKGDVNIFQAENYAIFQNQSTSTFWWNGDDDIVESPGDLGENWNDREMPETVIEPVAPVANIPICEVDDGEVQFIVVNSATEEVISGVTIRVEKNDNLVKQRVSDANGKASMKIKDGAYTYTATKTGFSEKVDVKFTMSVGTIITIRLTAVDTGYPAVLVLVLDQTGSIGIEGAARGIEIIDQTDVEAIGYVSFGDVIVQTRPVTTDLAAVRAELLFAVSNPDEPPFFGDMGSDVPENGVDAIHQGLLLLKAFTGIPDGDRALFFKTDTKGYAHQANNPAVVNAELNEIDYAWLEFGDAMGGEEEGLYETTFPETDVVSHSTFPLFI